MCGFNIFFLKFSMYEKLVTSLVMKQTRKHCTTTLILCSQKYLQLISDLMSQFLYYIQPYCYGYFHNTSDVYRIQIFCNMCMEYDTIFISHTVAITCSAFKNTFPYCQQSLHCAEKVFAFGVQKMKHLLRPNILSVSLLIEIQITEQPSYLNVNTWQKDNINKYFVVYVLVHIARIKYFCG